MVRRRAGVADQLADGAFPAATRDAMLRPSPPVRGARRRPQHDVPACVGNTYSIPTPAYDAAKYEVVGDASTTKTGIMLLQLIPIGQNDKIERAMQLLMQEKGGDALADVTIRESWFWAYVLNGYSVKVEAKVLRKKG